MKVLLSILAASAILMAGNAYADAKPIAQKSGCLACTQLMAKRF